jgi:hypothetical protein
MSRSKGQYNPLSLTDAVTQNDDDEQVVGVDTASRRGGQRHNYNSVGTTQDNDENESQTKQQVTLDEDDEDENLKKGIDLEKYIKVVILDSAQTKFPLSANPDGTVKELKKAGEKIHKVAPAQQRLIYRGKLLADGVTLRDCGIAQDDIIIHLFPKPRVIVTSNSEVTESSSRSEGGGAHVPQIVLDEGEAERRGQILVLGSVEIAEAQNNVKLLSLLLLVICAMRLLALFSIAMGVAEEPYTDDIPFNTNATNDDAYSPKDADYETRSWETHDYYDLAVSAIGFYVATLGMKATTENTLRLANAYLVGTIIAGVTFTIWNAFIYLEIINEEAKPKADGDERPPWTQDDYITVAFFTVFLPMLVWFGCCLRAWQFRFLLEEAEMEAAERIRSQLQTSSEEDDDGDEDSTEMTEINSNTIAIV